MVSPFPQPKRQTICQSKKDWLWYYRQILLSEWSNEEMKEFARKEIMLILDEENKW